MLPPSGEPAVHISRLLMVVGLQLPANHMLPLPWRLQVYEDAAELEPTPKTFVLFYLCDLVAVWRDAGSDPNFSTSRMNATLCFSSSGRNPRSDSSFTWNQPPPAVRGQLGHTSSRRTADAPTVNWRRSLSSVYRQILWSCSFTLKP